MTIRHQRVFSGRHDLHSVLEASPDCVVAVHADGQIGYVNPAACAAFGYSSDELLGLAVETLVRDDLVALHERHRARFDADPSPRSMGTRLEIAVRRKDGSELPVDIGLIPLESEDGRWVLATLVDVTARRAAQAEVEELHRGYRMQAYTNQAIVRAATVDALYADTCRAMVTEGGYLAAWVGEPQPSGEVDMVVSAGDLGDYLDRLVVTTDADDPHGQGPVSTVLRESRAVYVDDVGIPGVAGAASLPLRVRDEVVAVLTLYSEHQGVFGDEMRGFLEATADNISFGLSALVAIADLDRLDVQRRELVRRLVRAQEDERSRIAGEVHDDSVQSLAVVDLRLGLLLRHVQAQAPELADAVTQLQETVGTVSSGLRLLLFELEPTDATATLPEMFTEAAGVIFEGADVRWDVVIDATAELDGVGQDPYWLPEPARSQVVRVVKEALRNVRKHSGALAVTITIRPDPDGVEIDVVDDGIGIDVEHVRSAPGHRGLTTMRERVEMGGGWTQIEGGPTGTSLRFWMPRSVDGAAHTT